jgi:hypothetical protein
MAPPVRDDRLGNVTGRLSPYPVPFHGDRAGEAWRPPPPDSPWGSSFSSSSPGGSRSLTRKWMTRSH